MGWGNLVLTEAEKAFTGEVWSQTLLLPLFSGRADWVSAWSYGLMWQVRPVRLLAITPGMPSSIAFNRFTFRRAQLLQKCKKVRFFFKDYLGKPQTESQSLERLWSKASKPFLSTVKMRRSWRTGNGELPKGNSAQLIWSPSMKKKVTLNKEW